MCCCTLHHILLLRPTTQFTFRPTYDFIFTFDLHTTFSSVNSNTASDSVDVCIPSNASKSQLYTLFSRELRWAAQCCLPYTWSRLEEHVKLTFNASPRVIKSLQTARNTYRKSYNQSSVFAHLFRELRQALADFLLRVKPVKTLRGSSNNETHQIGHHPCCGRKLGCSFPILSPPSSSSHRQREAFTCYQGRDCPRPDYYSLSASWQAS